MQVLLLLMILSGMKVGMVKFRENIMQKMLMVLCKLSIKRHGVVVWVLNPRIGIEEWIIV